MSLSRRARRGLTLIELAVTLALIGIIGAAIGATLMRQQRFYRGAGELLQARESVRDAMEVLSADLRGLAVADTVRLLADSAMEFFATVGSSVVCRAGAGTDVVLPAVSPSGNTLTSFLTQPDTGDLAYLYAAATGRWERRRIAGFGPATTRLECDHPAGFGSLAAGRALSLTLTEPLPPEIGVAAPVRFVRRGRYSLYHGSDGEWYLGYRRCDAIGPSQCGAVQPLSGPYQPYSPSPDRTGLLFEYFEAGGASLDAGSSPLSLVRVRVTARSRSSHRIPGWSGEWRPGDSAAVSIAIRNAGL